MKGLSSVVAITFALAGCSPDDPATPETSAAPSVDAADTVFTNGRIYTVNEAQPWAEAVAVRGDTIVYVGDSAGATAYLGDDTESVDLAGRMMLPGFIDGHLHGTGGGLIALGPDLQTDDKEELLEMIRTEAEANPEAEITLGYGWRANVFPSTPAAIRSTTSAVASSDGASATTTSKVYG